MTFLKNIESVAFLGPAGSYTEMAKDIFCAKYEINARLQPLDTIRRVLEFLDETPNAVGVLPIENSIEGAVRETLDNLIRTKNDKIRILSELVMPIRHCLLSRTTEIYSISGVISHPQALAQCQCFINEELPRNITVLNAPSTSDSARQLQGYNLTYSAIGNHKTAEIYNLNILKENINDDKNNQTRFALIGDFATPETGADKTSLAFSTPNEAGALLSVLKVFQDYQINLSYIDSRPSKVNFGEYTFFVDFDGHILDEKISCAIRDIEKIIDFYRFVGSYEKLN